MGGKLKPDNTPVNGELVKAGGFGRYQWFVVISMILGQMSGGFITHGIAYLEMPPEYPGYLCTTTLDPTTEVICAPKPNPEFPDVVVNTFFCDNPDIASKEVDFAERPSNLYNLYT